MPRKSEPTANPPRGGLAPAPTGPTKIVLANLKGGTGKTALALNLAAGLARKFAQERQPRRILLLDLDPQCNCLSTLAGAQTHFANHESLAITLADDDFLRLLGVTPRPTLAQLARPAGEAWYPNLFYVPSNELLLAEVRRRMPSIANRLQLIQTAFQSLTEFDYVIVDTAPSIDDLLIAVLMAADWLIVPIEMDTFSMQGALQITAKVTEVARQRPGQWPRVLGYVANRYSGQRLGDRNAQQLLNQVFQNRVYQTIIPQGIDLRYSLAANTDVYRYAPHATVTTAISLFVEETLQRLANPPGAPA